MRRGLVVGILLSVSLAACSDDAPEAVQAVTSDAATSVPTTSTPTTSTPATSAPAESSPDTTPSSAVDVASSGTTGSAAVVPELLCTTGVPSADEIPPPDVYFAVDNQGTTPIVIDDPSRSFLTGASSDDNPLVPTIFAPGRRSPAFLAVSDADSVSWTIIGPDGQSRTATADATHAPECTDELLGPTVPDPRTPKIEYALVPPADPAATPTQVAVTAQVTGVPASSVCPAGLEPLAPVIWLTVGGDPVTALPAVITLDLTTHQESFAPAQVTTGQASLNYYLVDRCGFGTANSESWPMGAAFGSMGFDGTDETLCVELIDGQPVIDPAAQHCFHLPLTGGQRIRTPVGI